MIQSIEYRGQLFFKWNQDSKIEDINKDLPIDYKDGQVLSRYGDDIWILNDGFVNINIDITQVPKSYRGEFKRILFLIYITPYSKQQMISAQTLYSYARNLLLMFLYIGKNHLKIEEFFSSSKLLYKFIDEIAFNSYRAEKFLTILQKLSSINHLEIGFKISLEKQHIKKLKKLIDTEESTQHPIIPPRIYVEIINRLWEEVEFIKRNKKAIITFYSKIQNEINFFYGRNACYRVGFKYGTEINHEEAINQTNIGPVFKKYNIKDRNSLTKLITEIQEVIKNLIHAYTGMRRSEVMHLKGGCVEKKKDIYLIHGVTTKSSKKIVPTYWVATKEIAEVIRLQEEFIKIIATKYKLNIKDYYLFSSPSLFNPQKKKTNSGRELKTNEPTLSHSNCKITCLQNIMIENEDLKVLKKIMFDFEFEQHNEFSVGCPWNLTSHQWRRALVIYMNRSGLVEYGAIKRQLKHTNIDMTLYYGNGAGRMDEFDIKKLNENELSIDYKKEQPLLECLSFMEHTLDGSLNHGNMGKISSSNPIVYQSIEKTLEQFKNGRLSFKITPIGGCSSTEQCNEKLHCSFVACLGCESAVIKTKKLEKVLILTEDELKSIKDNPRIVNSVVTTLEGDLKIMKKALGHYKALEELV